MMRKRILKEKGQHVKNHERQELIRGTERRLREDVVIKDDKYWGSALWSERWTRVANLKLIRCWIKSQLNEFRAEVVLVVERVMTQAKEFWTRWKWWILREEMPVRMELTLSNLEPTLAKAMVLEVYESRKGPIWRRARIWKYFEEQTLEIRLSKLRCLSKVTPSGLTYCLPVKQMYPRLPWKLD